MKPYYPTEATMERVCARLNSALADRELRKVLRRKGTHRLLNLLFSGELGALLGNGEWGIEYVRNDADVAAFVRSKEPLLRKPKAKTP